MFKLRHFHNNLKKLPFNKKMTSSLLNSVLVKNQTTINKLISQNMINEEVHINSEVANKKTVEEIDNIKNEELKIHRKNLLESQENYYMQLIKNHDNSSYNSENNTEFFVFLSMVENMMESYFDLDKEYRLFESKVSLATVNGYKPLSDICDYYTLFTNKHGFYSKAVTATLKYLGNYMQIRNSSGSGVYHDYSQEEFIFSRKLNNVVDNLIYGIMEVHSFLTYEQIADCLDGLKKIGYKDTYLVEVIMQRINYDLENNIIAESNIFDKTKDFDTIKSQYYSNVGIPKEVFNEDNYNKSYYEKNGFWPGYGKANFSSLNKYRVNLIQDKKFSKHLKHLMTISSDPNDYYKKKHLNYDEEEKATKNEVDKLEEELEVMNAAIKSIIDEVKNIQELEETVTDKIANIINSYNKISKALEENDSIAKIQIRYDFAKLQQLIVEAGILNFSNFKDTDNLKSLIPIIKEFSVLSFPDLFNVEIKKFFQKLEHKDSIKEFNINKSSNTSIDSLITLLKSVESYSNSYYIEVNHHNYYNKDVIVTDHLQNKTTDRLSYSGLSSIFIENEPKNTITYDVMRKWFTRISPYLEAIFSKKTKETQVLVESINSSLQVYGINYKTKSKTTTNEELRQENIKDITNNIKQCFRELFTNINLSNFIFSTVSERKLNDPFIKVHYDILYENISQNNINGSISSLDHSIRSMSLLVDYILDSRENERLRRIDERKRKVKIQNEEIECENIDKEISTAPLDFSEQNYRYLISIFHNNSFSLSDKYLLNSSLAISTFIDNCFGKDIIYTNNYISQYRMHNPSELQLYLNVIKTFTIGNIVLKDKIKTSNIITSQIKKSYLAITLINYFNTIPSNKIINIKLYQKLNKYSFKYSRKALNKMTSIESFIYQMIVHEIGAKNNFNHKAHDIKLMLQTISFNLKNSHSKKHITPLLYNKQIYALEKSNDITYNTLINALLSSCYPDKIKSSSSLAESEVHAFTEKQNKKNNIVNFNGNIVQEVDQETHYLINIRELENYFYKPDFVVGYCGLKVPVFIIRDYNKVPNYIDSVTYYFKISHKYTVPVFIKLENVCTLNLASGEIILKNGTALPNLTTIINNQLKEYDDEEIKSLNIVKQVAKPFGSSEESLSDLIESCLKNTISNINNYSDILESEFVDNKSIISIYKEESNNPRKVFSQNINTFFEQLVNDNYTVSDKIVELLNNCVNNIKNSLFSISRNEILRLNSQLKTDSTDLISLIELSLKDVKKNSINKKNIYKALSNIKFSSEIFSQVSEKISKNIETIIKNERYFNSEYNSQHNFMLLNNLLKNNRLGTSIINPENAKYIKKIMSSPSFSSQSFPTEVLNNKFLWYDNYCQYSDWEKDLSLYYDNFNCFFKQQEDKYYFDNGNLGNRFVSYGIKPSPTDFKKVQAPKDLTSYLQSNDLSKLNRLNFQKTVIYKEIEKNNYLSTRFNTMTSETMLKVNLLNIIQSMKEKFQDVEIVKFIGELELIDNLKKEHLDYYNAKLQNKKEEIDINNKKKVIYLQRNQEAYIDYLTAVQDISTKKDDFTKTLIQEDEIRKELLRYNPDADIEQRQDEMFEKMEKWIEENNDVDNVFGDNNPNDPFYKFNTSKILREQDLINKETERYRSTLENKKNNGVNIIMNDRKLAERNIIIFSIYFKLVLKNSGNAKNLKLTNLDKKYLKLIKNNSNLLIKENATDLKFGDLSTNDIYALESLSSNIKIKDLLRGNNGNNDISKYSLNELIFELNKFIDPEFIESILKAITLSNDKKTSEGKKAQEKDDEKSTKDIEIKHIMNPVINYKENSLNLQRTFEHLWRRENSFSNKEINTLIDMFFLGRSKTLYQRTWLAVDKKQLLILLNKANCYDDRINLFRKIFNRKNIEINNRTHWPTEEKNKSFDQLKADYIAERKNVLTLLINEKLDYDYSKFNSVNDTPQKVTKALDSLIIKFIDEVTSNTSHDFILNHYNFLEAIKSLFKKDLNNEQKNLLRTYDLFFKITHNAEAVLSTEKKFSLITHSIDFSGSRIPSAAITSKNKAIDYEELKQGRNEKIKNTEYWKMNVYNHSNENFDFISEINKKI